MARKERKELTDHIQQGKNFAEVVPVSPPIVKSKILPQIVEQHFLLLLLLHLGTEADVEIHHQSVNLAALPSFPQPSRRVEENRLEKEENRPPFQRDRNRVFRRLLARSLASSSESRIHLREDRNYELITAKCSAARRSGVGVKRETIRDQVSRQLENWKRTTRFVRRT